MAAPAQLSYFLPSLGCPGSAAFLNEDSEEALYQALREGGRRMAWGGGS
jgi:hypothetical protein